MRRTVLAIPVAAIALIGWLAPQARAQDTKTARGTVTSVSGDSVMVKVGTQDMKFTIDSATTITAPGAGTKTRKAQAEGGKPKASELLSAGTPVEVKYHDMGGTMHAATVRVTTKASGSPKR